MKNNTLIRANAAKVSGEPGIPDLAGHFRPRITLQTLHRGDGLLGMKPSGDFGPRGGSVTVAEIDWMYHTDTGLRWQTPAPQSLAERWSAVHQIAVRYERQSSQAVA